MNGAITLSLAALEKIDNYLPLISNTSSADIKVYSFRGLNLTHVKTINCFKIFDKEDVIVSISDFT